MEIKIVIDSSELVLLDGKVSDALQKDIDVVKEYYSISKKYNISLSNACVIYKIKEQSIKYRQMNYYNVGISKCDICKKTGSYYKKRGQIDYSKGNNNLPGVHLSGSGILVKGSGTCCSECYLNLLPSLQDYLKDVKCEFSPHILPTLYKEVTVCICNKCKKYFILSIDPYTDKNCLSCDGILHYQHLYKAVISIDEYYTLKKIWGHGRNKREMTIEEYQEFIINSKGEQ